MDLREIKIIQGKTASGKTRKLLKEYINRSRKTACLMISFEENLTDKIPLEELNATKNYIFSPMGTFDSLDVFINKLNKTIDYNNINSVYIDAPTLAFSQVVRFERILIKLFELKANVYVTTQMMRDSMHA